MKINGYSRPRSLLVTMLLSLVTMLAVNVRGAVLSYTVALSGPNESPPNASLGFGSGLISYNNTAHTLSLGFSFSGLGSATTLSHIHAATSIPFSGTAGVATTTPYFAGFPIGVTSGSYTNTLDLTSASSWNSAYITANGGTTTSAELALANAMASGEAYLNIHTTGFPGGEIRGFLIAVPEPSTAALMGLGGLGLALLRRRRTSP